MIASNGYVVLAVLAVMALANLTEWLPIEVAALAGLLVLVAAHVIPQSTALSGFSNTAVWLVTGMMIVAAGVRQNGLLDRVADQLTTLAQGSPRLLAAGLTLLGGITGGLLESTAAVTAMIPVVGTTVRRQRRSAQGFFAAMALGAMAGGLLTLIGTSGNIVADAALTRLHQKPLGFFELLPLGAAFLLIAILYAVWSGGTIGSSKPDDSDRSGAESASEGSFLDIRQYIGEARVPANSPLIGEDLANLSLFRHYGVSILEIERGDTRTTPGPHDQLQAGDVLLVSAPAAEHLRWGEMGLQALQHDARTSAARPALHGVEVMLPPSSPWIGQTPASLSLRQRGLELLAIWRQGQAQRGRLASTRMRVGDLLLLTGEPRAVERLQRSESVVAIGGSPGMSTNRRRGWLSLVPLALFFGLAVTGTANLGVAALAAAALMLGSRLLGPHDAYAAVEWRVPLLLGAILPVASTLGTTGVTTAVARSLAAHVGPHPIVALLAVFLLGAVLTQILSNIATAAILTPVAVSLAHARHVEVHALVVTLLAALMMTPVTGSANKPALLVMSQGLRHRDYWKWGLVPSLTGLVVTMGIVSWLWHP